MWRRLLSGLAITCDVILLLLMFVALLGQTVMVGGGGSGAGRGTVTRSGAQPTVVTFVIEGVVIAVLGVNVLAVLFGSRVFPPRAATSDLVATFD